jgi:hypothetical protein
MFEKTGLAPEHGCPVPVPFFRSDTFHPFYSTEPGLIHFAETTKNLRKIMVSILSVLRAALVSIPCCLFLLTADLFGDTYKLGSLAEEGSCRRVQVALEVRGELRLNADGKQVVSLPLEVEGRLIYDERILVATAEPWERQAVRDYKEALAKIKAGKGVVNRSLAPDRGLIMALAKDTESLLFCPREPLCREDLDLIDVQGNSLLVDTLLPADAVATGDTWKPDERWLARLFGWDMVTQSDVTARLASVTDRVALIDFSGRMDGSSGGVATEIELNGKANFHLDQRLMTWFAVSLREKRAIGHAEPGFEVTARLRMAMQPSATPPALADGQLAIPRRTDRASVDLLSFQSDHADFRLIHDRRWRSMIDRHDLSVFRLVDRGDLIAQCNISELPEFEPGRHLSLDEFRADVQQKLEQQFGQIVEASQTEGEGGNRILRIVVSGMASEIPIQWVYYHISNDQGRRAALAFTFESKLVERFAEADRTLVETFQFTPRRQPTEARRSADDATRS